MTTTRRKSPYRPHPIVAANRATLEELAKKTGRSQEGWLALLAKSGVEGGEARTRWLVKEHGLGGGRAELLALLSVGECRELIDPDENVAWAARNVEAMYSGARSGLRPIHDALLAQLSTLRPEVTIAPLKTHVPVLLGDRLLAQIKPATRTRVDLLLVLPGAHARGRLAALPPARSASAPTHRIAFASAAEVDEEVGRWLAEAHARAVAREEK